MENWLEEIRDSIDNTESLHAYVVDSRKFNSSTKWFFYTTSLNQDDQSRQKKNIAAIINMLLFQNTQKNSLQSIFTTLESLVTVIFFISRKMFILRIFFSFVIVFALSDYVFVLTPIKNQHYYV